MKLFGQVVLLFCICLSSYSQSEDSLLTVLAQKKDTERIDVLHDLVLSTWLNYPDQAMKYGAEAMQIAKEAKDSSNISESFRLIAGVYYYKGEYDSSLDFNEKALSIAIALNDSSLINNSYNNLGLLYFELGGYQVSLEYLLRSKLIKDEIGELYGMSTTLNNIGRIFDRIGKYEEARGYFLEAYDVAIETDNQTEIYALNNIGVTYLKERRLDLARNYFRLGLSRAKELDNIYWGSASLRGLAEIFMLKNEFDSAKIYSQESLIASQSIEDKKGISESYYVLAKYALEVGDAAVALNHLNQSQEIAHQLKLRQQLLDNLHLYIKVHDELKNIEKVRDYQNEYILLRDSLFTDVVSRNLSLIPIKIKEESDRIKLMEQESEIQNKNYTNRLFSAILLIIVALILILIILLRKNQIVNRELTQFNEELQRTQKLLITSEKMASLGVMAAGVAHEINNPLNFIKNGVEALSITVFGEDHEKKKEAEPLFKIVKEGVDRATNIVKSLSHFSRKGPEMNEECNLKEIIENCLLILHSKIKNKIRVITEFSDSDILVRGNEGRLHQAMMNIIANAEQAIEEKGTIKIKTKVSGGNYEIMVEDDGMGIPEENLPKISDPFFTTKAPGKGTGLGLFITYSIIEEHNGKIDVISKPGKGTIFMVTLPLN